MKVLTSLELAAATVLVAAIPAPATNGTCMTTDSNLLKTDSHAYIVRCNAECAGQQIHASTHQENFAHCATHCDEMPDCLAAQYSDLTKLCETFGGIEDSESVLGSHVAVRDFAVKRADTITSPTSGIAIVSAALERREDQPKMRYCNESLDGLPSGDPTYDSYDLCSDTRYDGGVFKIFERDDKFEFYFLYGCVDVCNQTPSCVVVSLSENFCSIHNASAVPVLEQGAWSAVKKPVSDREKSSNGTDNEWAKRDLDYGRRKRGILYQDATQVWAFRGADSRVVWGHNWYSAPYGANCNNDAFQGGSIENAMTFIPTVWTSRDACLSSVWGGNVDNAIVNYHTDSIMSFNEPDMSTDVGGSALSPSDAADGWRNLIEPFTGRVALGAPATTFTGKCSEGGWQWLREFKDACNDCPVDFVPIHYFVDSWGDVDGSVQDFQDELRCLVDTFQTPIWITEMHYNAPSEAEEIHFLTRMMDFFETNDWISRYSYRQTDEMINPDGSPTQLGYCYLCYRIDGNSDSCCLNY